VLENTLTGLRGKNAYPCAAIAACGCWDSQKLRFCLPLCAALYDTLLKTVRISMKNVWLLILISLSACTTLEDLSPPTEKMSLTAIDDIFYYAELGIPRKKHLIGTTKGTFNLVGENESGYYFLSENSTYFVITDTEMRYYEEHKSLPSSVINKSPYGIWYPKKKTTKNPHFFLILKSDLRMQENKVDLLMY
jgi:hypothetical protein